ncbi:MAG: 4Fe-4S binding protein [Verrucomicrobia bacterium]|nr:4Fe-4S binding protein [Verrucomicrobiota bacterium]
MFRRLLHLLFGLLLLSATALAEQRFPPPDFESGYQLPSPTTPAPRPGLMQYLDTAVLLSTLALALWLVYRSRSRRGITALSLFSLAYFGFYRNGCVCAIGSVQNVALALPVTVLIFFLAPLVVALFAGRAFCAAVCPQGAIQDLVLLKPLKVPAWLEAPLGLIPYLFLGAGVSFAATGSGFLICRYDPLVPFFRFNGSSLMLGLGVAFLLVGIFVGRPYCRFMCPYGALLRLVTAAAKWRVRVTPDTCTQCALCQHSCPFGAMREPTPDGLPKREPLKTSRRRLAAFLLLLPLLVGLGAWGGAQLATPASQFNRTVHLAGRYVRSLTTPDPNPLSLQRVEADPGPVLAKVEEIRQRFLLGSMLFGGWVGLVFGAKFISLCVRRSRTDFEPDPGACVACARCFETCPSERIRRGWIPPETARKEE